MYRIMNAAGFAQDFTILENNCTQSIATASGYMVSPMISSLAAFMLVTGTVIAAKSMMIWMVVCSILGVLLANRIWVALGKRNREPSDFTKVTIGYLGVGAAYLYIALVATLPVVPVLMWIFFFLMVDFSFGWSEPPTQSLISRDSPPSVNAMMMATMKASTMK